VGGSGNGGSSNGVQRATCWGGVGKYRVYYARVGSTSVSRCQYQSPHSPVMHPVALPVVAVPRRGCRVLLAGRYKTTDGVCVWVGVWVRNRVETLYGPACLRKPTGLTLFRLGECRKVAECGRPAFRLMDDGTEGHSRS
jgi:hypothetical protein